MQTADNFTYKKVFYSIRGLMSAQLATQQIMPELQITELFDQISADDPLRHWAEDYLEIKKQQKEKALEFARSAAERIKTQLEGLSGSSNSKNNSRMIQNATMPRIK